MTDRTRTPFHSSTCKDISSQRGAHRSLTVSNGCSALFSNRESCLRGRRFLAIKPNLIASPCLHCLCFLSYLLLIVSSNGVSLSHWLDSVYSFNSCLLSTALVSCGCCTKLPQSEWLRTTEIYSLTVLEARVVKGVLWSYNQGVGRAVLAPEALGENPSSCLFWLLNCIPLQGQQSSILLQLSH